MEKKVSEFKWWLLSLVMACLIASTEVFICGWHNHEYSCDLISDKGNEDIIEPSEPYDFQFELDNDIIDGFKQFDINNF